VLTKYEISDFSLISDYHMAITKVKKVEILDNIKNKVANQKAVILIGTKETKVTVDAATNFKFRSSARKQGIIIRVCKNTLIQKSFPAIKEELVGQTYIAYLDESKSNNSDEVTVPKAMVSGIDDDFKDNFNIIGSVINGEFYDSSKTVALSKVPSFNDSMAMVAGSINQITAKIALTIKEIPASVARGVGAAKK
jgi:large subunit ribosomal protein L10